MILSITTAFHKQTIRHAVPHTMHVPPAGNISQMPGVLNGTNRYSAAVFVCELVRKCFVLEGRKEKIPTVRFIKENIRILLDSLV
jgi:hypothetical protein